MFTNQRFLAVIVLTFLLLIIFPLAKSYTQKRAIEKEIQGIQNEIKDFESQNKEIQEILEYLQTDQATEEQARLNLNMKKPGEEVVVIQDLEKKYKDIQQDDESNLKSNFRKWWDYFFK